MIVSPLPNKIVCSILHIKKFRVSGQQRIIVYIQICPTLKPFAHILYFAKGKLILSQAMKQNKPIIYKYLFYKKINTDLSKRQNKKLSGLLIGFDLCDFEPGEKYAISSWVQSAKLHDLHV